jgi:hypothetical protein
VLRPVGSVPGVKFHPAIPNMNLQTVVVALQLVSPPRPAGRFADGPSGGRAALMELTK